MKEFMVLKILDRFKIVFEKLGVDYVVMRKILQIKLLMDGRRIPTSLSNSTRKKTEAVNKDGNNFIKSLWVYVLMGLFMLPFTFMGNNFAFQMSIIFGILMFMVMTSLISDFSSVLLDIRDKNIISSKPVNSKTLSMAKGIHVFIYMFLITISLTAFALIGILIKYGILFFIAFLLEIILMDLFIVVLTTLLYLLILKFFDGEKLKDIINYVQIILSIFIAVGYQLVGRLFNIRDLNVAFTPKWWQYLIPPVWFGAPFEIIFNHNYNFNFIVFSILAIFVPLISIIIYLKSIPSFEQSLQKLNNNTGRAEKGSKKITKWISKVICSTTEERIFFRFSMDMMKNERGFKLKVYPSLGFALIFPFIFIFNSVAGRGFESISSSKIYLFIYFCALMLPTVILMMRYSEKYNGGWIYKAMPIKNVMPIFKGSLKAFIIRLLLPIYTIDCLIFMAIFGIRIFPDLVLVFLNMLLFTLICFITFKKALPFSEAFEVTEQGEGLKTIPLMLLLGAFAGIHYASTLFSYGVYVYIFVMLIMNWIMWGKAFRISWDKIVK